VCVCVCVVYGTHLDALHAPTDCTRDPAREGLIGGGVHRCAAIELL